MWGQALHFCAYQNQFRIIPTRVGTRMNICVLRQAVKDHPHACGDKRQRNHALRTGLGSSPRVWGQGRGGRECLEPPRIIPTRVGTSSAVNRKVYGHWDHPHACGDKKFLRCFFPVNPGSSPRVWGQGSLTTCSRSVAGIIPTRVGTRAVRGR